MALLGADKDEGTERVTNVCVCFSGCARVERGSRGQTHYGITKIHLTVIIFKEAAFLSFGVKALKHLLSKVVVSISEV